MKFLKIYLDICDHYCYPIMINKFMKIRFLFSDIAYELRT